MVDIIYKYETHCHTAPVSKCGKASAEDTVSFYKRMGYDGIFITNHFLDGNINPAVWELPYSEQIDFYFSDYEKCRALGVNVRLSTVWAEGGNGGKALAEEVVRLCEQPNAFSFCYPDELSIEDKIRAVVTRVYRGKDVVFTPQAKQAADRLTSLGYGRCPVCLAKTQYSFSDDPLKLGAPEGFTVTVRNIKISAGAGFVVALTGEILTMPGLPKSPAAERIDVDENGRISGLF